MEANTKNPAASALGKLRAKQLFAGMTKKERSEYMKQLRARGTKKRTLKVK